MRKIKRADIVHIHMAAVERKMPFVWLTKVYNKPLIIHLHFPDPMTTVYNPTKAWRYRWCLKRADRVIALSHSWKDLLGREWGIRNIDVIYNPCPDISPAPTYNALSESPYILYAGNLSDRKGYRDLMEAFARVKDRMVGWTIKFAGNGELENARILACQLGITESVEFLGWINGDKKDRVFRNASVYCLPSYAEGFPMGVLDAWAYHVPVITTPVGGLPEILVDGRNALSFTPGDIVGLSECLLKITDFKTRTVLSHGAEDLSTGIFNVDTINRQVGALYNNLVSSKK